MNKRLSWERDLSQTVVIVYGLGNVVIDGALLKDTGLDMEELTDGCIFCKMKADLNRTLKEIRREYKPGQILIEFTGVSVSIKITGAFDEACFSRFTFELP